MAPPLAQTTIVVIVKMAQKISRAPFYCTIAKCIYCERCPCKEYDFSNNNARCGYKPNKVFQVKLVTDKMSD